MASDDPPDAYSDHETRDDDSDDNLATALKRCELLRRQVRTLTRRVHQLEQGGTRQRNRSTTHVGHAPVGTDNIGSSEKGLNMRIFRLAR